MKTFINLGLAASLVTLTIAGTTFHDPTGDLKIKRGFFTCQETYGGGSTTCGGSSSHYCYDPTLGESCCLLDNGYCKLGDFCAPVAGFCCHNGEDPATCAARLAFTLPPSFSTATSTTSDISIPTDLAVAPTTLVPSTSTIEVIAADPAISSIAPVPAPILGAQVSTTTSTGVMTPDFTAMINQTAPSATPSSGLGAGAIQFTGAARRVDLGMGVGGFLGVVAVAGLVL